MRRGEELRPIQFQTTKERQLCAFPGCDRMAYAKGLCIAHRKQQLKGLELKPITRGTYAECTVEGCGRKVASKGHCQTHARYRMAGKELKAIAAPAYRYVDSQGYIRLYLPDHPNAAKNGMVMEHIKVMSDILGRPLRAGETVHHINNNARDDNRPENLQLRQGKHGKGARFVCLDCGSHNVEAVELA
jgi:hypothetical protein